MRHIVNCDKVIVTPDVKTVDLVRRRKPVLESPLLRSPRRGSRRLGLCPGKRRHL